MPDQTSARSVVLTAFEPSGDDLGAAVVRRLRQEDPSVQVFAWGGARLREAGAEIVEDTTSDAAMGVPGPRVVANHLAMHRRIAEFFEEHPPDLFVAVDSPAANFPVCKQARKRGIRICHVAAPQLWAWAPWRIRKLRRLTDRLLCLLPFEEDWFRRRGVPASFIGHPVFDEPLDEGAIRRRNAGLPDGSPRIALLPGSRAREHADNFPVQLAAFRRILERHEDAVGVVGAVDEQGAERLRAIASEKGGWPAQLAMVIADTEGVIHWSDLCVAVSGTVTLHIARQARPMIVMFRARRLTWHLLGRWLIRSPFLAIPNLVAGRRIVPELMPYFGDASRLNAEIDHVLDSPDAMEKQRAALREIRLLFAGRHAAGAACAEILALLDGGSHASPMGPEGFEPSLPLRGSGF